MSSFIDHTLLQFTFSSAESLSIVKVKVRLFCTFNLDLTSLFSRSQVNMVIFSLNQIWSNLAYFRLPMRQKAWWRERLTPTKLLQKLKSFQMKGRNHTSVPIVLRIGGGIFGEVCQATSQSQQRRVNVLYNVGYWSHYPWSVPFIFKHKWPHLYSLTVFPYESATLTRRPASADRTARAANFRRDLEAT